MLFRSMGKMETFTFMVPGLYGGSNGGNEHGENSKFIETANGIGIPDNYSSNMVNGYSYWGSMSSLSETTSGPAYLGAIICFLFIVSIVFLNGWKKWGLLAACIFGMILGWGSNFYAFNSLMLDYFPMYNKFRAPSMAMVIPQFCIPFMGALGLHKYLFGEMSEDEKKKKIGRAHV